MGLSKFSDGIIQHDGRKLQKAYIHVPSDYYVNCPFCGDIIECGGDDHVEKCTHCNKEFYAEFSLPDIL